MPWMRSRRRVAISTPSSAADQAGSCRANPTPGNVFNGSGSEERYEVLTLQTSVPLPDGVMTKEESVVNPSNRTAGEASGFLCLHGWIIDVAEVTGECLDSAWRGDVNVVGSGGESGFDL